MKRLYVLLIATVFFSCSKNKEEITKSVNLNPFKNIEILDAFDVELVEDSAFKIEIIGAEGAVEKISYSVEDEKLTIEDKRKWKIFNPKQKVRLRLTNPNFGEFVLHGGCNLTSQNVMKSFHFGAVFLSHGNTVDLELDNNGFYFWNTNKAGGEITLRGKTDVVKYWYSGLVVINSVNLISKSGIIETSSDLDANINIEEKIEYLIKGKGNVILHGNPAIIQQSGGEVSDGEGELIIL